MKKLLAIFLIALASLVVLHSITNSISQDDFHTKNKASFLAFSDSAQTAIIWIKQYSNMHNRYPQALPSEIEEHLSHHTKSWWYKVTNDETSCYIGFGDYEKDGFIYYWSSESGEWILDK